MRVDSLFRRTAFASCAMACSIALNSPANAQCERDSAQAPLPANNDWYGNTVAISGEFAAAGWYTASFNGVRSGAVVMYQRDALTGAWGYHSTLVPPDNEAGDGFGTRVAMDGNVLVASARWDDDNGADSGSAYVYRHDAASGQWLFEAKLLASDGAAQDDFGSAVAISGNVIVIGAGNLSTYFGAAQRAYIFQQPSSGLWSQETILSTDVQESGYAFAVATDGTTVLVSGYWNDYGPARAIEWVDVYERSSAGKWTRARELLHPHGEDDRAFGITIAMDSGAALIGSGAFTQTTPPVFSLSAFVYSRTDQGTWEYQARLDAPAAVYWEIWIVHWLAIAGDHAVIGTTSPIDRGPGVASLYRRLPGSSDWSHVVDLTPSQDLAPTSRFGFSVDLDDAHVVIGAPEYDADSSTTDAPGSVYFIDLAGDDCNGNSLCDDLDIASGFSLDRNGNGVPDECETIPGDLNNDGLVNIDDLLVLIAAWGPCPPPPASCVADIAPAQGDHVVNIDDLLLLSNWSA